MSEIDNAIKECDLMIDRIIESDAELKENYAIITSIKGVARQNGACLLIFTNNFRRFDLDARKIACYYGVAPFGKDSGTSIHSPAKTSHFANKLIKSLLGQAAHCAKKFNPEIREYYNRLIGRGKKPQVALNNVKNKLIRIIVALVRKKVYYDPKTYMFYNAKFTDVKQMLNSQNDLDRNIEYVVSPNTRLINELNKHPTLIVYMCAPFCKGAHTYNNRSIILFHPLSVEILAIFVF